VQFSSAAWRIAARDEWIGWDDRARVRNLQHIVNNSRFLVLPWVQIKNLASRILSEAVGRVVVDWAKQYRVKPLLAETLVDPRRYRGTCYRAANWDRIRSDQRSGTAGSESERWRGGTQDGAGLSFGPGRGETIEGELNRVGPARSQS
jgi:hypothetical protein